LCFEKDIACLCDLRQLVKQNLKAAANRTRENGLKLCQGRFRLDICKNFYTERAVKHWNRLPREAAEAPSLEGFKSHVTAELRDTAHWWN